MEQHVIRYPLATEKAIRMIESDNIIIFVVERDATKTAIKEEIEKAYKVKVEKLNTLLTPKGQKRALARLSNDTPALDIATQLGLI